MFFIKPKMTSQQENKMLIKEEVYAEQSFEQRKSKIEPVIPQLVSKESNCLFEEEEDLLE